MKLILALFVAAATMSLRAQDHGHLNVGSNGSTLTWDNGAIFAPATGYVKTLVYAASGKYVGRYQGKITLTAMHSKNAFGEIDPAAPKPGAFIVGEIVSVEGPAGGVFSFWESTSLTNEPTVSIPAGTTNAGFRFDVSEAALGAGQPDGDAYGHIHGRRFTVNLPGVYTVGFRAHDTSSNGPNGGPLHSSSPIQLVTFQGGVNVGLDIASEGQPIVRFGALAGYTWQLQATDRLDAPTWTNLGQPVLGDDSFHALDAPETSGGAQRFYRAVGTLFVP